MTDCQFVHINAYSSTRPVARDARGRKKETEERRWSASDVLDEATREDGAVPHIKSPIAPNWLKGNRVDVEMAGKEWAEKTKYAGGRKVRSDAPWLAAAVVSMPRNRAADWPKYRDHAVTWFKSRYKDRLRGVVEHLDEEHPHMHLYLVPHPGEEFGMVHAGYAAKTKSRREGKTTVSTAFKAAMSTWLDDFHAEVASKYSLARIGPQRKRLTRAEWKLSQLETEAATQHALLEEQINVGTLKLDQLVADLEAKEAALTLASLEAERMLERALAEAKRIEDEAHLASKLSAQELEQRVRSELAAAHLKQQRLLNEERKLLQSERATLSEERRRIEGAYAILQGTEGLQRLSEMREHLQSANEALTAAKLAEAQTFIDKAMRADPAPLLKVPPRPKPK